MIMQLQPAFSWFKSKTACWSSSSLHVQINRDASNNWTCIMINTYSECCNLDLDLHVGEDGDMIWSSNLKNNLKSQSGNLNVHAGHANATWKMQTATATCKFRRMRHQLACWSICDLNQNVNDGSSSSAGLANIFRHSLQHDSARYFMNNQCQAREPRTELVQFQESVEWWRALKWWHVMPRCAFLKNDWHSAAMVPSVV